MAIVSYLPGEHGVLYALLSRTEALAPHASMEQIRVLHDLLVEAIRSHAEVEDELLFEPLERATPRAEAGVRGMRTMHDDIDSVLETLRNIREVERARELLLNLAGLAKQHFFAEEDTVFPMAEEALDARTREELGQRYLEQRGLLGMGSHV